MGGACSVHEGDQKFAQNFSQKYCKEETTCKLMVE
jgi:hypothetical protein